MIWATAAWGIPHVTSFDFRNGSDVVGRIGDRSLQPIAVMQNSPSLLLGCVLSLGAYALCYGSFEVLVRYVRTARFVWLLFVIGCAVAVVLPYFPTTDPYSYALYGYVAGPLGLDPWKLQHLPNAGWGAQLGALFPDVSDAGRICNYGPVFVFAYAALAIVLAKFPLIALLYGERVFGACCVAATGLLVSTWRSEGRVAMLAAFLLNPLVILECVAFAHGEALLLAILALAYTCWLRRRPELCALCIAAAIDVRSIAVLALVAFLVAVWSLRRARMLSSVASFAGGSLAFWLLARFLYRDFALGGLPALNPYSSPFLALATLSSLPRSVDLGVAAGLVAGALVAYVAVRRWLARPQSASLVWLSLAGLVASPSLYAHYVLWVSSLRTVTRERRFTFVATAAAAAAPLAYLLHVNPFPYPGSPPWAYACVLAFFWLAVAGASLLAGPRRA